MDYTKITYEDRLKLRSHSFEILKRFEFKYAPVGFKFLNAESDLKGLGLEPLGKKIAWCQMLPESQKGRAFYAVADDQFCEPGIFLTGHGEAGPNCGRRPNRPALRHLW